MIIDNVLDHVTAPDIVLREIHRVLADNGILYIEVNIHTFWGFLLHRVLSKLRIDMGHPYPFTANKIRRFLGTHQFSIEWEFINDYSEARTADRTAAALKAKLRGYSGLSEFVYGAIGTKNTRQTDKR